MSQTSPQAATSQELSAGPIRLKFQDGELRYLHVGDREVIRRIYFAVRNGRWNTSMPQFTETKVRKSKDGFTIDLKAECKTVGVDYSWTGRIVGTPDGKITFTAAGVAGTDFASNRIGLCVLYGSPAVVGRKYETINAAGQKKVSAFPEFVNHQLVAPDYQTLRYTTPDEVTVTTTVTGAEFDMEDQRTYGDSSFKAYAPLPYAYPAVPRGDRKEQVLTLEVTGAKASPSTVGKPVVIRLGNAAVPGAKVPKITTAEPEARGGNFGSVNGAAERNRGAKELSWSFSPLGHLPDDDTLFENVTVLQDQARSARSFAPDAALTLNPVFITSTYPRPGRDIQGEAALAAAWSATTLKYAALAGITETRFQVGSSGPAAEVLKAIGAHTGRSLTQVTVEGGASRHPVAVDAFAVQGNGATVLFLVNTTNTSQKAEIYPVAETAKQTVELMPYGVLSLYIAAPAR